MIKGFTDVDGLNKECIKLYYYLIKQIPNNYVLEKYQEAHRIGSFKHERDACNFDDFLIYVAGINPVLTKLADVYTTIFYKTSVFRKKLILLLAIIESCSPACAYFESPDTSSKPRICLSLILKGFLFVVSIPLSAMILLLLYAAYRIKYKLASSLANSTS